MIEHRLLALEKDLLGRLISRFEEAPRSTPPCWDAIDTSLLSSAWQKAIRRGDIRVAQQAVACLHEANPGYVWRRMRGIALEEVSIADLELVGQILAIAGKQVMRHALGDRDLALHLTARLALAPKCRTACDLLMWLGAPAHEVLPHGLPDANAPAPLREAVRQALAWLGITARSVHVQGRWARLVAGDNLRRDQLLEQSDCPDLVQFVVRRGGSTDALNSLLVPVYQLAQQTAALVEMPSHSPSAHDLIGPVPSYAYCLFSGPGKAALRRLLTGELGTYCQVAGIADPLRAIGHAVFQREGGYCLQVIEVAHAPMIRHRYEQTTLLRYGVPLHIQHDFRRRVRSAMPALYEHRQCVYTSGRASPAPPAGALQRLLVEETSPLYGLYMDNCKANVSLMRPSTRSDADLGACPPAACPSPVEDLVLLTEALSTSSPPTPPPHIHCPI